MDAEIIFLNRIEDPRKKFMEELTENDIMRFTANARKLFADEYDWAEMDEDEVYAVLCDCARYAFYNGENQIKNVVFNEENYWIGVEFCKDAAIDLGVKDAIAHLFNASLYAVPKYLDFDGTTAFIFGAG